MHAYTHIEILSKIENIFSIHDYTWYDSMTFKKMNKWFSSAIMFSYSFTIILG